jgi:hypothetical protein
MCTLFLRSGQGLEFLWRVALEVEDAAVSEASISLLTRLHYSVGPTSQLDLASVLQGFLGRCMATVEKSMRQKRWQACARCLQIIDKLLTLSDASGEESHL